MTNQASGVAFNGAAPQEERTEALAELQQAHKPGLSDLIPSDDVRHVIEHINSQYQNEDMYKSGALVPFPSKAAKAGDRGMQSVRLDDWALSMNGDFWDRPSALGFDSLRSMVEQTPVLNAVILTRIRQVQRFCRVADKSNDQPGFEIRHVDRNHQIEPAELESIHLLNRFMSNCGWEFNPRKRKVLRRDSFSSFMAKSVRDSLTFDSAAIETEWKRDKSLGIDGFYAVDGSTIRLCSEQGYRGDDEIFALQVVQGRVSTPYTFENLVYEPRNPRTDVNACGYGLSEVELLVRVVTGFLNAMSYNIKGFDSNAIPKGMLHMSGNYTSQDIDAFKRYWNSMVKGVNNAWSLPVMVSKDQDSKASFEKFGIDFNEMYFSKWMTFLTSIICAIFGMSPAEINFDSFTGGSSSALSGSDTAEKLAASKDSGLRPLLSYYENLMSDFIIGEFSDKYVFRWTGLDPEDADKRHEMRKLVLSIDEIRAEEGYEASDNGLGDAPVNPALIGPWMQLQQAAQQQDEQPDFGQPGAGQPGDDAGNNENSTVQPNDAPPASGVGQPQDPGDDQGGPAAAQPGQDDDEGLNKSFAPIYVIG